MMKLVSGLLQQHWQPLPSLAKRVFTGLAAGIVVLFVVLLTQSGQSQTVSSTSWLGANPNLPATAPATAAPPPSASVLVQVVGEVQSPGVYSLPFGSRVLDAVFAAGGFSTDADQASTNLARVVNDGEQIIIAPRGVAGSGGVGAGGMGSKGKLVNLNLADVATLDTLPGIGPTLAQRIIDYRVANGGFRSISDLGRVAGIGANLLARLKPLVSL